MSDIAFVLVFLVGFPIFFFDRCFYIRFQIGKETQFYEVHHFSSNGFHDSILHFSSFLRDPRERKVYL